jgi:polyphosphate glucokinase
LAKADAFAVCNYSSGPAINLVLLKTQINRVTEISQKIPANVLVVDIGGHNIKLLATGQTEPRKLASGPKFTPAKMVNGVKELAQDWKYDVVSIGFPAPVRQDRPVEEPFNLGRGWVGFDYREGFGRSVKMINDAAMQALGCYQGGKMLFLGLGTGLGSSLVVEGIVVPTELCRLPYKKATFEDYVGTRGLERLGKKKWRSCVEDVVARLVAALQPEDVVLGGGNVKYLKEAPPACRIIDNNNAFIGGFRLWDAKQ